MSYCSAQRNSACSSSHQSKPKIGPRAARRPRGSLAIHFIIWQPSTAKSSEMPDNQSCGANKSRAPRTGGRRRNKRAASELLYGNRGPHVKTPESRCWCGCARSERDDDFCSSGCFGLRQFLAMSPQGELYRGTQATVWTYMDPHAAIGTVSSTVDYICGDGRFWVSASCMTISNHDSSSGTGV